MATKNDKGLIKKPEKAKIQKNKYQKVHIDPLRRIFIGITFNMKKRKENFI